jgi:hypothetical protein
MKPGWAHTAGRNAAVRACSLLAPVTSNLATVSLPDGSDPASTLQTGDRPRYATRSPAPSARSPIWSSTLIMLGRLDEAGRLLRECQQVFEDHADTTRLARVLSTRADLENVLGHPEAAAEFGRTALRLGYARPDPATS